MIGGEPMPDRPKLAETVRVPMVVVPVELLERCRDGLAFFRRNGLGLPKTGELPSLIDDLQDALATH